MKLKNKIFIVLSFFLLTFSPAFSCNSIEISGFHQNEKVIRIAQYPRYAGCDRLFDLIFHYTWESNDTIYKFNITELTLEEIIGEGERPLNNDNFDLLIIGATFDGWTQEGLDPRIQENVKIFLSQGGGYLSVCGGTIYSTQGYKNPKNLFEKRVNKCVLKIVNVHINLNINEEAQYIRKCGKITDVNQGLVPLENKIERNNTNPIFSLHPRETINISYGGGPGMYTANASDPNLGRVTPLLVINEELMETKTIHWYIKRLIPFLWWRFLKIKTDMYGQYGGIATTYGNGRVVIFTGHPEIQLVLNGTIKEGPGRPTGFGSRFPPYRVVFTWTGTPMNMSHNWWIHRRAAAWIAGVPDDDLPPCNQLMVFMDKPGFRLGPELYIKDQKIGKIFNFSLLEPFFNFPWLERSFLMKRIVGKQVSKRLLETVSKIGKTVIIGDITVEAYAENSDIVEFYLDGELKYTDTEHPYIWKLDSNNLDGVHSIELHAYDEFGCCVSEGSEFFFYNF